MTCTRCEEQLSDFRDGQLPPEAAREVAHHLSTCRSCRDLQQAMEDALALLSGAAGAPDPAPDLPARLAAASFVVRRRAWATAVPAGAWLTAAVLTVGVSSAVLDAVSDRPGSMVRAVANRGASAVESFERARGDLRLLGVMFSTAVEGRLDRMEEHLQDYRRLLEEEQARPQPASSPSPAFREPAGRGRT